MNVAKVLIITMVVALGAAGFAVAVETKPQTVCPVMGGEIDKDLYVDHDGKRVYFCCPACVEPFKKDPATYLKKLADAGVTLEDAPVPQTVCPVMGGKITKTLFVDYNGKRIYACCAGCLPKIQKDPAKFVKQLEADGITLAKTPVPQTVCPVMGGKIDKSVFADYNGSRVYFCCAGCIATFNQDPATHVRKIKKAGITLAETPA